MNVEPGDMAKFVNCKSAGAVCIVIGPPMFDDDGYDWEVMMLQGVSAVEPESSQAVNVGAGARVWTFDKLLRRIDPDAEDETPEPQRVQPGVTA